MGNLFTEAMGNYLTTLMGNVLTTVMGKVLDIYKGYKARTSLWYFQWESLYCGSLLWQHWLFKKPAP